MSTIQPGRRRSAATERATESRRGTCRERYCRRARYRSCASVVSVEERSSGRTSLALRAINLAGAIAFFTVGIVAVALRAGDVAAVVGAGVALVGASLRIDH